MDLTVYLPDEIGSRAKEAELNFSRLLRNAVEDELERRKAVSKTLGKTETYDVDLLDEEDRAYIGRITGKLITESDSTQVFLTDDRRVLMYDGDQLKHWEVTDEDLKRELGPGAYMEAMAALGLKPTVEL